ncbi:type I-E CRISPR-associated protein Cse2/CasB [Bifidobacterium sp. MA2]|uniref:Type I-E CRISPR-associated protein Cse2/CasB n=1 Tax=Bifidobacterium santillanense TaxID=2809028 RepID=A0ABS5ULL2_9BIFI|nr:type I-E CRISPR-associated protein Cse2/CasB [Bifidobacterium santillanense]MBT1171794.1 type I-E CRISPR-associated protein Cse2/CasB [Bifidobacterium santillanense]
MGRYYSQDTAKALAEFVDRKIQGLQDKYTGRDGGTPESRARLARLRRGLDGAEPSWMMIGDELFTGWPDSLPDPDVADEEIRAAKAALELYALHQQSRRDRMAQRPGQEPSKQMTFGRACRLIEPPDSDSGRMNPVLSKLRFIEGAPDFDGVVRGIRGLVMLMRRPGKPVSLNYRSLTRDLYRLQFPDCRAQVFERWSSDYFSAPSTRNDNNV